MTDDALSALPLCELCGEPMPPGEEMFKYHGHSGPCPKPPKPTPTPKDDARSALARETLDRVLVLANRDPFPWDEATSTIESALSQQAEEIERLTHQRDAYYSARNHYDQERREAVQREAGWKGRAELAESEVASLRAELEQAQQDRAAIVGHIKAFLGPDWGNPTEPQHQQSFLVMAIHHLAGSRDNFRAAWEQAERALEQAREALREAMGELSEVCRILKAGDKSAIDAATEVMLALDIAEALRERKEGSIP